MAFYKCFNIALSGVSYGGIKKNKMEDQGKVQK